MRAVTAYTRFGSGGYLIMGLAESIGFGVMALAAQFAAGFCQNCREIRAVRIMALQAILCGRFMVGAVDPELGNGGMAGQAQFGLILLENITVGRAVGCVAGGAFPLGQGFMFHGCSVISLLGTLMATKTEFFFRTAQDIFIIRCVRGVTLAALTLGHRGMGGKIFCALLLFLMTGQTQLAAAVLRHQETGCLRPVQLVALAAVSLGKGFVQAEPAALHRGVFMAGETEFPFTLPAQEGFDLGLMRNVTAGAFLRIISWMGASAGRVPLLLMAIKAQFPRVCLEHGLLVGHMSLVAGQTFAFDHGLVLADGFSRTLRRGLGAGRGLLAFVRCRLRGFFLSGSGRGTILGAGNRGMTGKTDALGGIGQHGCVITGMHGMAGGAFALHVRLVHACPRLG